MDRNRPSSWHAGPMNHRFHRRNLASQGSVQCTWTAHVSLVRTCTDKSHVRSKGQNMKVKGRLCDHVDAVGNIGTWSIPYPITLLPNISNLPISSTALFLEVSTFTCFARISISQKQKPDFLFIFCVIKSKKKIKASPIFLIPEIYWHIICKLKTESVI